MKKVLKKIWNSSPNTIYKKIHHLFHTLFYGKDKMYIYKLKHIPNEVRLWMPKNIPETYIDMLEGSYEDQILKKILSDRSNETLCIWDIGAHIGYHSLLFASITGPKSKIISFEPNPNNVTWFKSNISLNPTYSPQISVYDKAISDKLEDIDFNIGNKYDATSSGGYISDVTPPLPDESYKNFSKISLKTTSIDNLIYSENFQKPDILKIDVEGAELKVLIGGIRTIRECQPELIIEIHNIPMMFYVSSFLKENGYEITLLDEENNNIHTKIIHAKHK